MKKTMYAVSGLGLITLAIAIAVMPKTQPVTSNEEPQQPEVIAEVAPVQTAPATAGTNELYVRISHLGFAGGHGQ